MSDLPAHWSKRSPVGLRRYRVNVVFRFSGLSGVPLQEVEDQPDNALWFICWTDATMRAVAWSVENPEEAVALFVKKNPAVSLDLARGQWRIVVDLLLTPVAKEQGIGSMAEEKMRRTRDTLVKYQKLEGDIPLRDLYTNEFLPKLFPKRPVP